MAAPAAVSVLTCPPLSSGSPSLAAAANARRPPPAAISAAAAVLASFSRTNTSLLLPAPPVGISRKTLRPRRAAAAAPGDAVPSEAVVENVQSALPAAAADGATSVVISGLLIAAFVGLSILTVGVIYIAVTDFLQKREREKFEKEEAPKKKEGKKVKAKGRAGPRGFGQKVEVDDDE